MHYGIQSMETGSLFFVNRRISVLMPARGECPYIWEALRSVAQSTFAPFEVLIINDGMSQLAIDVVTQFRQKFNLKLITNEGSGLVDALNTGLKNAKGEFIARLDNDDLMLPRRLEIQIGEFETNPALVALGSECVYINPKGVEVGKSHYPIGVLNSHPGFSTSCLLAHPSTMFRRDEANYIGGYRTVFTWNGTDIGEDFDFWLRMAKRGEIVNIPLVLTKYRQHSGQLSMLNLAGQLIGTPFIAGVNLLPEENDSRVSFDGNVYGDLEIYRRVIRKAFGVRRKFSLNLLISSFRLERLGFRLLPRILRKLVSILNRVFSL